MKSFTIASIVALASVATAQLESIPSCALNCFIGPFTSDGCPNLTDFACHCQKGTTLLAQVLPCVQGACSQSEQAAAMSAVESTCSAAGVPITIPGSSSAAPSEASSAAASVASSVASVASSILSEASSVVESAASSVASVASSAVATPIPTGNVTTSATPSPSQFTGGAAQATQAVGILGAAALAMLAL